MARWIITPRFTIRTLLVVTLLVAIALAVWRSRPSPWLTVELTASGTVLVDQQQISPADLPALLDSENAWRKRWRMQPVLVIRADSAAPYRSVLQLIERAKTSGFDRFTFAARSTPQALPIKAQGSR